MRPDFVGTNFSGTVLRCTDSLAAVFRLGATPAFADALTLFEDFDLAAFVAVTLRVLVADLLTSSFSPFISSYHMAFTFVRGAVWQAGCKRLLAGRHFHSYELRKLLDVA